MAALQVEIAVVISNSGQVRRIPALDDDDHRWVKSGIRTERNPPNSLDISN
jgi:hypothetical protein